MKTRKLTEEQLEHLFGRTTPYFIKDMLGPNWKEHVSWELVSLNSIDTGDRDGNTSRVFPLDLTHVENLKKSYKNYINLDSITIAFYEINGTIRKLVYGHHQRAAFIGIGYDEMVVLKLKNLTPSQINDLESRENDLHSEPRKKLTHNDIIFNICNQVEEGNIKRDAPSIRQAIQNKYPTVNGTRVIGKLMSKILSNVKVERYFWCWGKSEREEYNKNNLHNPLVNNAHSETYGAVLKETSPAKDHIYRQAYPSIDLYEKTGKITGLVIKIDQYPTSKKSITSMRMDAIKFLRKVHKYTPLSRESLTIIGFVPQTIDDEPNKLIMMDEVKRKYEEEQSLKSNVH